MKPLKTIVFLLALSVPFATSKPVLVNAAQSSQTNQSASGEDLSVSCIKKLPNGGSTYIYNSEDGAQVTYYVPPEGFDPLHASDKMLAEYGFPKRPTDSKSLAEWQNLMEAYKFTAVPSVTKIKRNAGLRTKSISNTAYTTQNWSGVEETPSRYKYTEAEGEFIQPTKRDGNVGTAESTWVGIGGDTLNYASHCLIQCGTAMVASGYYIWWETLNTNDTNSYENKISNFIVRPGDKISLKVSYEVSYGAAYFFIINETTGQSQQCSTDASQYYDGSTAEFIDERPSVNGYLYYLADYGTVSWSNCQAVLSQGTQVIGKYDAQILGFNYLAMKNSDTGHILSRPYPFTNSTDFIDKFYCSD